MPVPEKQWVQVSSYEYVEVDVKEPRRKMTRNDVLSALSRFCFGAGLVLFVVAVIVTIQKHT